MLLHAVAYLLARLCRQVADKFAHCKDSRPLDGGAVVMHSPRYWLSGRACFAAYRSLVLWGHSLGRDLSPMPASAPRQPGNCYRFYHAERSSQADPLLRHQRELDGHIPAALAREKKCPVADAILGISIAVVHETTFPKNNTDCLSLALTWIASSEDLPRHRDLLF